MDYNNFTPRRLHHYMLEFENQNLITVYSSDTFAQNPFKFYFFDDQLKNNQQLTPFFKWINHCSEASHYILNSYEPQPYKNLSFNILDPKGITIEKHTLTNSLATIEFPDTNYLQQDINIISITIYYQQHTTS